VSLPKKFHIQAGEYKETSRKVFFERRGIVIRWLKKNPLSTAEEILAATSISISSVVTRGMFKNVEYDGKRCWRVTGEGR
jgi:dTDP-4-dehydrorhamnose 3,5-epimerase-like enzyme